jgi:bla regulator protein blaR1
MVRTLVIAWALLSASAGAQTFEVAAIKPSQPAGGDRQFSGFQTLGGGRFNTVNTSVRMMIAFAYNIKDYQLSGGPGWANSENYDITAKAESNATEAQFRLMLQALLKDRFKLALRHETKDAPIYELVVAKGGSKLQEDATSAKLRMGMTGRGRITAQKAPITAFLSTLGMLTGRPVVDKTGLTSTYAFTLEWTPDPAEGGPPGPVNPQGQETVPPDTNGPSLFTALQEQLGLRLQSAKGPVDSLTIESVERPSEN